MDDARVVGSFLSMTPAEGDWRVVIIDSADAMNRNAANALLKILEEPPARALLLLVSHNPGGLLPTIRSRCRVLRLMPLNEMHFSEVFSSLLPEAGGEEKHALSVLSGGSAGVAVKMHSQQALSLYREMLELMQSGDTQALHQFADRLNRKDAASHFEGFTTLYPWTIMRLTLQHVQAQAELFMGEAELLLELAPRKSAEEWSDLWERAQTLLRDTDRLYLDKKQTVLTLMRECR